MTQIHLLPVIPAPEASGRLAEGLVQVLAAGIDPGPRHHQIRALQRTIGGGLRDLAEALAVLSAEDPQRQALRESVERYVRTVEDVMASTDRIVTTATAASPATPA
ncbi:hypothetical protein [Methylobacterium sp. JK268]